MAFWAVWKLHGVPRDYWEKQDVGPLNSGCEPKVRLIIAQSRTFVGYFFQEITQGNYFGFAENMLKNGR